MNALTYEQLDAFRAGYENDRAARTATAAMAKTELGDLAFLPMEAAKLNGEFALEVKTRGVTAQEKSGRCWMFAALNILREVVAEKLGLKEFEFSENYLAFYDKLEKCNNFLEMVIASADKTLDDRMMEYILGGIGDGGYWDMAVDLIRKYGVVPKYVMPENYQSSHTEKFRKLMNDLLRKDACVLRAVAAAGGDLQAEKQRMMAELYKAECIVFGEPVQRFDFTYRDERGAYHADRGLTPQEFCERYVGFALEDYICVSNSPTAKTPLGALYEFHYMGSMAESNIRTLNLSMDELQELALAQLRGGTPVWFACDSGAFGDRKQGVWDPDSFDYEGLLGGAELRMSKTDALEYRQSGATHAMILVGADFDENGSPTRWKIENSWGKENGRDGYFVCSQRYFREYVYEAIIDKKLLSEAQRALLEAEPVVLQPWEGSVL